MATTSKEFWDRIAHIYSQQVIGDEDSYHKKLAETQALMTKGMFVLEVGCGTGTTAIKHSPFVKHILATDISSEMITIAQEKAIREGTENITFTSCSVEEIEAEESSFDMVLALNLLHLLPDRNSALNKFHKLLKPGGLLITSTVCLADKMWFIKPLVFIMQLIGKAPYVNFLSSNAVLNEIVSTGFKSKQHWTHGKANSLFMIAEKI
jgi:ubiquinone/menaquinone biosynthesis C-methylase UbiE